MVDIQSPYTFIKLMCVDMSIFIFFVGNMPLQFVIVSFLCIFSFIEMYLRPPFASEEIKIDDWIKVRQCGIRYYLSLGDQRIVDKYFIIRPKAEFEVHK